MFKLFTCQYSASYDEQFTLTYWFYFCCCCEKSFKLGQFYLHLNQIYYHDVPYIPFNVCQIWLQSNYALAFYGSFFYKSVKRKEKTPNKMSNFFEGSRNGWRDLLQIWYMISPDMLAPA